LAANLHRRAIAFLEKVRAGEPVTFIETDKFALDCIVADVGALTPLCYFGAPEHLSGTIFVGLCCAVLGDNDDD
jgi:hypothetical protein